MTVTDTTAAAFINSLGVDTHLEYTDGGYANIAAVELDLKYLGITNVRDGISDGTNGSAPLSSYIALAQQGVKFTFVTETGGAQTTASLNAVLGLIEQVNMAVSGSVIAVEGPNEINNYPLTFNGSGGLQGAVAYQTVLYAAVHSNPELRGVAVDYFTGYNAGGVAVGPNPAVTPGLADYDTQHPYASFGQAPAAYDNLASALSNETAPFGPVVYTEAGYSTNSGYNGGVNQDVQAKYTLDMLLDDARNGVSSTYLYQLLDAYEPGSPQGDDGYGLFDPSNAPKEAAVAIHNLVSILEAGASMAATASPTLDVGITGLPVTGASLEIDAAPGVHDIAVWNEPQIWNEAAGQEMAAASTAVTVNLGGTYQNVEVFDPLTGTAPLTTFASTSTITLAVTDHPLLIQVTGAATTAGTGSTGSTSTGSTGSQSAAIVGTPGSFITTPVNGASLVKLGAGTETVQAQGADTINAGSGLSTVYANNNSNPVTVIGGGSGSMGQFIFNRGTVAFMGETGTAVTYTGGLHAVGGSGAATVSLNGGNNSLTGGTGTMTVFANSYGGNNYIFAPAGGGGMTNIFGFAASDTINLHGYATSLGQVRAESTAVGGGTSITLPDGTHINLAGVSGLASANFQF